MVTKKITLLTGITLECVVGKPFEGKTGTEIFQSEGKVLPVFENFAHFLLENADRIMNDSRMFFCPIYSQVFSPFFKKRPRLGTFIEWWLNYPDISHDNYGNPIFCISGNPMTGSHACYSVDKEGNSRRATERKFWEIITSFGKVNSLYEDVKIEAEYYEFEEVLKILCGETYEWRRKAVDYKIELEEIKRELAASNQSYSKVSVKLKKLIKNNREQLMNGMKDKILDFYSTYTAQEKEYENTCQKYNEYKRQQKILVSNGELTQDEYEELLKNASASKRKWKQELNTLGKDFMKDNFGNNPNEINLKMVLDYAKHQVKGC